MDLETIFKKVFVSLIASYLLSPLHNDLSCTVLNFNPIPAEFFGNLTHLCQLWTYVKNAYHTTECSKALFLRCLYLSF